MWNKRSNLEEQVGGLVDHAREPRRRLRRVTTAPSVADPWPRDRDPLSRPVIRTAAERAERRQVA